jgi:hypothetical protein
LEKETAQQDMISIDLFKSMLLEFSSTQKIAIKFVRDAVTSPTPLAIIGIHELV